MLEAQNMTVIRHVFVDHHEYQQQDFTFEDGLPIVMTEKDAVKCQAFAIANAWYVKTTLDVEPSFFSTLVNRLSAASASNSRSSET